MGSSGLGFISEVISTRTEFEAAYNTYTRGLSPAALSAANFDIYDSKLAAGNAEVTALNNWYSNVDTVEQNCSTSISSYAEFGHCYSHATAGRPWAQIGEVDRQVRSASLSHGSSSEISVLWSWYKLHATVSEKHDFENNALVHMEAAGLT